MHTHYCAVTAQCDAKCNTSLQSSDAVSTPARDCDFKSSMLIKQRHLEPPGNCQVLRGTRMVKTDVVPATLEDLIPVKKTN